MGPRANVPLRLFTNRTLIGSLLSVVRLNSVRRDVLIHNFGQFFSFFALMTSIVRSQSQCHLPSDTYGNAEQYYLPLWYQATKGVSATHSGLDILPFMIAVVVGEYRRPSAFNSSSLTTDLSSRYGCGLHRRRA
jgi:hypothetical protein